MTDKKIYRYTVVELLDLIKNGQSKSKVESAKAELEKRNLTEKEIKNAKAEYLKFLKFKEKRKDEPLTREEWFSFFITPLTPKPSWRKDHFSESEFQRFETFGFNKKSKQATEARVLGFIFWFILIVVGISMARYFNL